MIRTGLRRRKNDETGKFDAPHPDRFSREESNLWNRPDSIPALPFLAEGSPEITSISHPTSAIEVWRFEATFQVGSTVADNLQWPYDSAPPIGLPSASGISVDGLFSPDNWSTVYVQPAFLSRILRRRSPRREALVLPDRSIQLESPLLPNRPGTWAFRLRAHDAGGTVESTPRTFEVAEASSPGFIQVSPTIPAISNSTMDLPSSAPVTRPPPT